MNEPELLQRLRNADAMQGIQPTKGEPGGMAAQSVGLHHGDAEPSAAKQIAGHAADDTCTDDYNVSGFSTQLTHSTG